MVGGLHGRARPTFALVDGGLWRAEQLGDRGLSGAFIDLGALVRGGFVSGLDPGAAPVVWGDG